MSEVELSEQPKADGYSISLPTFEGPLDLLLHLCQKHELDILDIPIGFVTEKYLEYLAVIQLLNLDVASEYLVMAATLAHIKSKMLLPAPPPGQEDEIGGEEEDPREALIRRLLEYQKYKHAGEELAARGVAGRDVFLRGMPTEEAVVTGLPPLAQVPLFSLVEAFQNVLSKSKVTLSHDIVHERVTLADRINELVDILRVRRRVAFEELFEDMKTRFDLVITFLALLEMTRLRMTRLFQENFDSTIYVEFTAQVAADDATAAENAPNAADGNTDPLTHPTTASATEPPATGDFATDVAEGEGELPTDPPPAGDFATNFAEDADFANDFADSALVEEDAARTAELEAVRFDTDEPPATDANPVLLDGEMSLDERGSASHVGMAAPDDEPPATRETAIDTPTQTIPCPPPPDNSPDAPQPDALQKDALSAEASYAGDPSETGDFPARPEDEPT